MKLMTAIRIIPVFALWLAAFAVADDPIADIQRDAIANKKSPVAHWGTKPDEYSQWTTHSNRLVPVYLFGANREQAGVSLKDYTGENSLYRDEDAVRKLYGRVPEQTVHAKADYMDQTDVAAIQRAAVKAGKKYIFLVVFDGMDWQTTQAASIYRKGAVSYREGRGDVLHLQTYTANNTTEFGGMVTSPHNDGTDADPTEQKVKNPGGKKQGGYDPELGGFTAWAKPKDLGYLITKPAEGNPQHAYTDSAASATSMTAGIKTYNNAINVDHTGFPVETVVHELQDAGWAVGAVSSVPISHATPACAYAHNVTRKDYQDISRDLLGLPSVSHPKEPLPGLDVVIGGGFGKKKDKDTSQGDNFESGNSYLADSDLAKSSLRQGGRYVTVVRKEGKSGSARLRKAAKKAADGGHRLLGFFGVPSGHLPFQTANGDYKTVPGQAGKAESYSEADIKENPTLPEMTSAALEVMESRKKNFWLMIEAGDVDWANHDNNLDNSIGAVFSGDAAVKVITDWVEANSNWDESLMIVTADHGHLLVVLQPEKLTGK